MEFQASYFPAQNRCFGAGGQWRAAQQIPPGLPAGCGDFEADDGRRAGLRRGRLGHGAADVDESVGDDAEADPAFHSGVALVAAAVEAVSAFGHADAPLASGAPFLAVAEPALLLFAFARGAFGGAIGNADALDAFGFAAASLLAE